MKRLFTFAAFVACAFGLSAQFTVLKSGNIRIGNLGSSGPAKRSAMSVSTPTETDSLASLNLLRGTNNGAGAYITFGN